MYCAGKLVAQTNENAAVYSEDNASNLASNKKHLSQ